MNDADRWIPGRTTKLPVQNVDIYYSIILHSIVYIYTNQGGDRKKNGPGWQKKPTSHCHGATCTEETYGKGEATRYGQPRKQNNVMPFWSTHIYIYSTISFFSGILISFCGGKTINPHVCTVLVSNRLIP